jgi:hypothetical protein
MNKKGLLVILSVFLLSGFLLVNGCDNSPYDLPQYTEFQVHVDSIEHPSHIFLGQNLTIKFYAMLGPNGCYTFSRFDAKISGNMLNIAVYGKQEKSDVCNDGISYLYGGTLQVNRLDTGMYIIHVNQPVPPDIYDTVYVKKISVP